MKAHPTRPKGIKLPNGGKMQFGQIIGGTSMDSSQKNPQRPLNSNFNPRSGAPKHIAPAPIVPGQRSRIGASHAAYTGPGQAALDDEPNLPLKSHAKSIALHPATPPRVAAKVHPIANDPNVILNDAANLGRKA